MLVDQTTVVLVGGDGGRGAVTFRKEKFVPFGGPDGGDGGSGGSVFLCSTNEVRSLAHLAVTHTLKAEVGGDGRRANKIGKAGTDLLVQVPVGTEASFPGEMSGPTLMDLASSDEKALVCSGGNGGRGNRAFSTSTMKVPRIAEVGEPGETRRVTLTYKMPSDIAIIGEANSGKSTLLNLMTGAGARVADYPITTVDPIVGVMEWTWTQYRLVEIPATWISSAVEEIGSLKHAQRAKVVLVLLAGAQDSLSEAYRRVSEAMAEKDHGVGRKPRIVVVNKADVTDRSQPGPEDFPGARAHLSVSAATGEGMAELQRTLVELVRMSAQESQAATEPSAPVLRPTPMSPRISVARDAAAYVVHAGNLERLVMGTDMSDWEARMQLMSLLERAGVHQALQKAGVKEGDTIRIGGRELEWT